MIYYFSATGNSLMAARALAQENEKLVDMAEARKSKAYRCETEDDRIGLVFPVYCYTLPDVVLDFVRKLTVKQDSYVFAVITCGGSIGGTGVFLANELKKRGLRLSYLTSLLMPDNAIFYYDLPSDEKDVARLEEAKTRLLAISSDIAEQRIRPAKGISSRFLRPMYHALAKTKKFRVTEKCISCGMCARNCPDDAIRLEGGKPQWVKPRCTKCSACINRCPTAAIEYASATKTRNRYVNPILKKGE